MTKPLTWVAGAAALAATSLAPLAASAAPTPSAAGAAGARSTASPGSAPAGLSPFAPAARSTATAPVTLPSGDVVSLTGERQRSFTALRRTTSGPLLSMTLGKSSYLIPAALRSQVGGVLDPALFDIRRLASAPAGIPVTIRYASATAPTAVPGVEIASRSGLTARGIITPASSRALGEALRTQSAATLFAQVAQVQGLSAGTSTPAYPMHTVTVTVTGPDGKPYDGMFAYLDTLDPQKPGGPAFAIRGKAKISVPQGRIQLVVMAMSETEPTAYFATSPEFVIDGPRSVSVDVRTATSQIRTVTERPVSGGMLVTEYFREIISDAGAWGSSFAFIGDRSMRFLISPTTGVLHGRQAVTQDMTAEGGPASAPYRYTTHGGVTGRIPDHDIVARATSRNTSTYRTTLVGNFDPSQAIFSRGVGTVSSGWTLGANPPARSFTEYVSVGPGLTHSSSLVQQLVFDPDFAELGRFTGPQITAPAPGTTRTDVWGRAPLHQQFGDEGPAGGYQFCSSCVGTGTGAGQRTLLINARPLSDGLHTGGGDVIPPNSYSSHVTLKADNTVLADSLGDLSGTAELPSGAKVISATQVTSRAATLHTNATKMTTSISANLSSAFPAPASWLCSTETTCSVLPFLSLDYAANATLANVLPAGRQQVRLDIKQVGRAKAQGINSVKAWVSYDARTWSAVPVTGSGASYAAALTVPKASAGRTLVGLKVAVTDAAGSTLTEQIDGAYRLAR